MSSHTSFFLYTKKYLQLHLLHQLNLATLQVQRGRIHFCKKGKSAGPFNDIKSVTVNDA